MARYVPINQVPLWRNVRRELIALRDKLIQLQQRLEESHGDRDGKAVPGPGREGAEKPVAGFKAPAPGPCPAAPHSGPQSGSTGSETNI